MTVKHVPVPILAVSRAWEWKGFHLQTLLFACIAKAIIALSVEPAALLIQNGLCYRQTENKCQDI